MSSRFRKAAAPRLSHDEQVRQGNAVREAHAALQGMEAVRLFLNTHNDELRGRPLDVATASDDGFRAVQALIGKIAEGR